MKFRHFTKPTFLTRVGREQLGRLFARFTGDLEARNVRVPPPDLDDATYYNQLCGLVMKPDALPNKLIETLFAIEEMANPEGQERLEAAATQLGLDLTRIFHNVIGNQVQKHSVVTDLPSCCCCSPHESVSDRVFND